MDLNTNNFSYDKTDQTLAACASDLDLAPHIWPPLLCVTSQYTGRRLSFTLLNKVTDDEGEVQYTVYIPLLTDRGLNVKQIMIFND